MLKYILPLLLAATPALAQQTLLPVTLSPQEYATVMSELARRDPIMGMFIRKQDEAQQESAKAAQKPPIETQPK